MEARHNLKGAPFLANSVFPQSVSLLQHMKSRIRYINFRMLFENINYIKEDAAYQFE